MSLNEATIDMAADCEGSASFSTAKRKAYSLEFKMKVVENAKNTSNNSAAKHFGISRSVIIDWRKQEKQLRESLEYNSRNGKKFHLDGAGRKPICSDLEADLYAWYESEYKERKLAVSRRRLLNKGRELYLKYRQSNKEILKFSKGWLDNFLLRHNIVQRRTTTKCQKPPSDYVEKLVAFILYASKKRLDMNYQTDMIYAADETAVWLDPTSPTTLAPRGSKDVPVASCGYEKLNLTVVLTARGNGKKCLPYVLLNRKRPIPEVEKAFKGKLILSWSGKTWMDDDLTEDYLRRVIEKNIFQSKLLVWDSFRCHTSVATRKILNTLKIDPAVIPGGCTRFIQPADVSWNSPFKAKILELHNTWMSNGNLPLTRTGNNIAPPSPMVYLNWILQAWNDVSCDVVKNSFTVCGITNSIDGAEDEQIHAFKKDGPVAMGFEILKQRRGQSLTPVSSQLITERFEIIDLDSCNDMDSSDGETTDYDSDDE